MGNWHRREKADQFYPIFDNNGEEVEGLPLTFEDFKKLTKGNCNDLVYRLTGERIKVSSKREGYEAVTSRIGALSMPIPEK